MGNIYLDKKIAVTREIFLNIKGKGLKRRVGVVGDAVSVQCLNALVMVNCG